MSQSSIAVTVRVRPFTANELQHLQPTSNEPLFLGDGSLASSGQAEPLRQMAGKNLRKIVNVVDDKMLIFDPSENNPLTKVQRQVFCNHAAMSKARIREHRFVFDRLFDEDASQDDVFCHTTKPLLDNILDGYNATVFAYGATGCGKTHTISGTPQQPGIIFLTMRELFERINTLQDTKTVELSLSYLEIYNETIRDLLVPDCGKPLMLREDAEQRISVSNLSTHNPQSVEDVMDMILQGNTNRTTSPTDANAVSSRSHAVLQINVSQRPRTADLTQSHTFGTLSIIDLAGSERASATKNRGERLLEGANINRSLLALGNCINALCDPRRRGHVPYRDSKLTRLLKFSLGGNCKTVMIVCISPSSQHYDETLNTLQYADRAKKIKTKVTRNEHNLDRHVGSYLKMITEQKAEIEELRKREEKAIEQALAKDRAKRTACAVALAEAKSSLDVTISNTAEARSNRAKCVARLRVVESKISQIDWWLGSLNLYVGDLLADLAGQAIQLRAKLIGEKEALQQLCKSIPDVQAVDSAISILSRRLSETAGWTDEDRANFSQYCESKKLECEHNLLRSSVFEIPLEGSLQTMANMFFQALQKLSSLTQESDAGEIINGLSSLFDDLVKSCDSLLNDNIPTSLDITGLMESSIHSTPSSFTMDSSDISSFSTPLPNTFTPAFRKVKRPSIPAKRPTVVVVRSPRRKISKRVRWDDAIPPDDSNGEQQQEQQQSQLPDGENSVLQPIETNSDSSLDSNQSQGTAKKFGVRGELRRKITAKRKGSAMRVNPKTIIRVEKENQPSPGSTNVSPVPLHLLGTASSVLKQKRAEES